MGISPTRCYNKEHAIAVANLYFSCQPARWIYEPREPFTHEGKHFEWRPDCLLSYGGKLYAVEVQRSNPAGKKPWSRKWFIYNMYFNNGYFEAAKFQEWAKKPPIIPQFLVVTKQNPETVKQGFDVVGRELIVVKSM